MSVSVLHAQTSKVFEETRIGMEPTPLYRLLQNLERPQPLSSFKGSTKEINVIIHRITGDVNIKIKSLAPFHTLEDLHRTIWLQQGKQDDLFPKYSYLAVEDGDKIIPAMYTFVDVYEEGVEVINVVDPRTSLPARQLQTAFVEEDGEKKQVDYRPRGRITLEDFFESIETIPTFHLFPFSYCMRISKLSGVMSAKDWYGLFYPYFPSLDRTTTGQMTEDDVQQSKKMVEYTEGKINQVALLEDLLNTVSIRELRTTQVKHLSFQWLSREREDYFEGVDTLFFSVPVNEKQPFMRLLTPNTTPMTKLYQPDPMQPPQVNDPVLLKTWVDEPNPDPSESILFVKALIRKEEIGLLPLYGTLRVMDDTTATFTIQPPKEQRILDFQKDLSRLEQILTKVSDSMPFNVQDALLGRANIKIELMFDAKPPKNIKKQIADRMGYLSTLFQPIPAPSEDERPFLTYRYKAVSNFTSDDRISSYITYVLSREGIRRDQMQTLAPQIAREFQISEDDAIDKLADYFEKGGELTTTDNYAKEFLVRNNKGIDIALSTIDIKTFAIQLFNLRAISIQDILRVCTALSLVFYGTEEDWDVSLKKKGLTVASSLKVAKAIEVVEQEELKEEEFADKTAGNDEEGFFLEMDDEGAAEEEAEKPVAAEPPPKSSDAAEKPVSEDRIVAHGWFIRRLQKLDPKLFAYKVSRPGQLHYSSKCANNEDRYPLILTTQQYLNMRKLYAKDEAAGLVGFVVYGIENTADTIKSAVGKLEVINVLRYGSDPSNLFYFLCHGILCLRDMLPILEKDWKSESDYYGENKPKYSCPFCHGTEIKNREKPETGETVFIRVKKKPKNEKAQTFVRFLANPDHPAGYELPCCFPLRKDIEWSDERFKFMRDAPKQTATEEVIEDQAAAAAVKSAELEESLRAREQMVVSYDVLRWRAAQEYILGSEKYPLEPGKLALPSVNLDAFLGQDSTSMVARLQIKQVFKPNAHGFFRLGVLNKIRFRNQSLFSALAPLLGMNTVTAVVNHLTTLITPRVFINLNFGNLMLEFFDPADPEFPAPPDSILSTWAQKHLLIANMEDTRFEISRFYRSYHRFIKYINDDTQIKQLRHFVHALAEPDLLVPNGLTIMTILYNGDPRDKNTAININCPMMGFDTARYSNNSVGFLTYFSKSGIWEPLVYVDKLNTTGTAKSDLYFSVTQQQIQEPSFPEIVRNRYIDEFLVKCRSAYRGAFTLQSGVDNRAVIPLTRALDILQPLKPTGIVRDIYNHVVALTLKNPTEGRVDDVLVPVVDDGNIFHNNTALRIHLGMKSIYLASANDVYSLYETKITPRLFPISNVYKIHSFLMTSKIVGFRLGGPDAYATILLPCGTTKTGSAEIPSELVKQVDAKKWKKDDDYQFEYTINHEIMTSLNDEVYGEKDESAFILQRKQVDIIYEHFRLSFANWIASMEASSLRKFVKDLIELRKPLLPNYEKMRRLRVEFEPTLRNWFVADDEPTDLKRILIRNDCIAIEEEGKCTNMCKYDNGTCKIHVPTEIQVRSSPRPSKMDAASYFIERLLDEIVRLPARRNELLTKGVRRLQVPSTNIHIGDQWILPENVPAWYDLLRQDSQDGFEIPQYYEEFSRKTVSEKEEAELTDARRLYPLPASLANILPEKTAEVVALEVIGSNESRASSFRRYFGLRGAEEAETYLSTKTLTEISKKYSVPVVQIQLTRGSIVVEGRVDASHFTAKVSSYVLVPDFEEGPALMVMKDDVSDTIPAAMLKGKVYESIQPMRIFRKPSIEKEENIVQEEAPIKLPTRRIRIVR